MFYYNPIQSINPVKSCSRSTKLNKACVCATINLSAGVILLVPKRGSVDEYPNTNSSCYRPSLRRMYGIFLSFHNKGYVFPLLVNGNSLIQILHKYRV